MKFVIEHPLLDWYKYDVKFTLELLNSYVKGIEENITKSISDFKTEAETIDVVEGEDFSYTVEVYKGLDNSNWNFEAVFEDYFPNLQRESALITIYSFFEHELNKLCKIFIEKENMVVSLTDLNGKGILRAFLFLEKIVGLEINRNDSNWQEMLNIQKVRNLIVQNNSILIDKNGNPRPVKSYVSKHAKLSENEDKVKIGENYLSHVLDVFKTKFEEIDKLIIDRQKAE